MIAPVRSVYGFGRWSPATTNTMPSPATSINCASSEIASIDCGVTYWFAAVNARGRSGRSLLRSSKGGYHHPESCTHIRMLAFTLPILHKSRMRRRARTDLSGGRSVMSVPTGSFSFPRSAPHLCILVHDERRRSLRAGEDPWPLEYQDDRTLCQAGAGTHRQNRQHGAGNLEAAGERRWRPSAHRLTMYVFGT